MQPFTSGMCRTATMLHACTSHMIPLISRRLRTGTHGGRCPVEINSVDARRTFSRRLMQAVGYPLPPPSKVF